MVTLIGAIILTKVSVTCFLVILVGIEVATGKLTVVRTFMY